MAINELNDLSSGHEEWSYQKNLRMLQELIVVLNHLLKIENTPILAEKINYIKKTRSENLSAVFLSPEGRQYITLCYLAIKFENKNEIISNYCIWVDIESKDILSYLLKRLDLFIISLKILNNGKENIKSIFKLTPTGILPGSYIGWNICDDNDNFIESNTICIDYNNGEFELWKIDGNDFIKFDSFKIDSLKNNYFFEIPHSKKYSFSIDIFSQVALINFNGREQLPRLTYTGPGRKNIPHNILFEQIQVLEKALDFIAIAEPSLIKYFIEIKNSFVPLIPPNGALPSSSNSSIDDMFWYSASNSPLLVAEMIIHEYSHQKLFRLQDIDPLIDREKHGSGWENSNIYSPWRDDPRPINGVFHGFVVFSEASNFWLNLIEKGVISEEEKNIALRRFAMLASQLKYACESLSKTHFTKAGERIFRFYESNIYDNFIKKVSIEKLYDLEPFFMEFHDEILDDSKITIKEIVDSHRNTWLEKNIKIN